MGPLDELIREIKDLFELKDFVGLKALVANENPADIAEILTELTREQKAILFRLLGKEEAVAVFEFLQPDEQKSLLEGFHESTVREIIEEMSPDDRAHLLDEMPAGVAKRLLTLMSPGEREMTNLLLGYGENTAGRIMTPEYLDLKQNMTVDEALTRIRRIGQEKETVYYGYVMDDRRKLIGVVSLRDLVLADPSKRIAEIANRNVISVSTDEDQEQIAAILRKYDFLALPVVDREKRLVGIVTVDDIMDVIEDEATEDFYRAGGLAAPEETSYFRLRLYGVVRQRFGWLLVLLLTNTFTGNIILGQSDVLKGVVSLAAFIPLLIDSGGNVGSQSSTVVIRGLALREITFRDAMWVLAKEGGVGFLLGIMLGLVVTIWAYFLQGSILVALVVGLSLVAISTLASVTGALLPLLFQRFKLDPALMSSPFITTVVDVAGVLIYFQVARFILGLA
ncbi:MAG: magnesium transporter [Bacillota bacterium]